MFLPEQPLLDTQEASLSYCPRAVEGSSGPALLCLLYDHYYHHNHHHYHHLVGGGVHTLSLVVLGDRGGEAHPVVVRDLEQENMSEVARGLINLDVV